MRNRKKENNLWQTSLKYLEQEFDQDDLNMWVYPLQAEQQGSMLRLLAPNAFVRDSVEDMLLPQIRSIVTKLDPGIESVLVEVGGLVHKPRSGKRKTKKDSTGLSPLYTFENYVQGKSNQLARAAAIQIAENPGGAYNPLLLYGSTGLGKTHLLHAAGNYIHVHHPDAQVVYMHSEDFVRNMVQALRHNTIDDFKRHYRNVHTLLIDDIQFFAGKERSQEEFFHTFNALLEGQQQVVFTCDRYPKEVDGIEERLKSRFGWGLSVSIEPPDFETRVAILISKARGMKAKIPEEVAYFVAKRIHSNVRDLEGALNTLVANAHFSKCRITVEFAREALRDLLAVHEQAVTLHNIKKTVAGYYGISVSDLHSKRRTRAIARPRQIAMTLSKDLTQHSLPEIGESFGGRDHSTVLHAHRKIRSLCSTDKRVKDDFQRLLRTLST